MKSLVALLLIALPQHWVLRARESADPCPQTLDLSVSAKREWTLRFHEPESPVTLQSNARNMIDSNAPIFSDLDRREILYLSLKRLEQGPVIETWLFEDGLARFRAGFHCEFEPRLQP